MSNVSSILECKHEDVIDLTANYILHLEKPISDPLKNITQCVDQIDQIGWQKLP